ncbi:FAD-dependent monooxygenase [Kineosporia sp. J2-2]|uniref:FAD-dependent monooxygenase n=1 Tax=Kineosporia corallincola TaxID=2835133 RepID=A0ABS5TC53_9ACTN|nr:FAD-dependent monooxygenase [Kineosporia corallincola]MBT0768657.1 FAD-dependent monooxygenase [Kineosporia corallincola]
MSGVKTTAPRVLVTGGSIAGPAAALGLLQAGLVPTLMERAAGRRSAGQNVDIRNVGREVLRRMGQQDRVAAAGTGEVGTRFLRPDGSTYASVTAHAGEDGPTAELEILRGELSRLLLEATSQDVEHRFGEHLVEVTQDRDGVHTVTDQGREERYDLLVVAEGRRSRTRDLVFAPSSPDGVRYRDLGQYVAYGTIDRAGDDDQWWKWLTALDRRVVSLRPDNLGTARAALAFMAPAMGVERIGFDAQIRVLRERFADVGWQTQRIIDGFQARPQEFYFERAEQVTLPRWYRGRVAVLGDSAWAGPTGMGTTLALLGAHVLAGELAEHLHRGSSFEPERALSAYQHVMRPFVDKAQKIPPGIPGLALPKSAKGLKVLHAAHRLAASRILQRSARHLRPRSRDVPRTCRSIRTFEPMWCSNRDRNSMPSPTASRRVGLGPARTQPSHRNRVRPCSGADGSRPAWIRLTHEEAHRPIGRIASPRTATSEGTHHEHSGDRRDRAGRAARDPAADRAGASGAGADPSAGPGRAAGVGRGGRW